MTSLHYQNAELDAALEHKTKENITIAEELNLKIEESAMLRNELNSEKAALEQKSRENTALEANVASLEAEKQKLAEFHRKQTATHVGSYQWWANLRKQACKEKVESFCTDLHHASDSWAGSYTKGLHKSYCGATDDRCLNL